MKHFAFGRCASSSLVSSCVRCRSRWGRARLVVGPSRLESCSEGFGRWRILIFKRWCELRMEHWIMEVRSLLQGQLKEVFENAKDLGKRYLQEVMDANKSKDWNQKNTLQFRVRQRGNAIALEWYAVSWYGDRKSTRLNSSHQKISY